jgi:DNA-binding NarL/FixJ family response regulator
MIKIILVDDHKLIRESLKILLAPGDILVVGEAENGQELIQLLTHLAVDVILMDIQMPLLDGIAATAYVQQHYPLLKVLGLSMHDNPFYALQMLEAGARGFISKSANKEELLQAIKMVNAGQLFLPAEMEERITYLKEKKEKQLAKYQHLDEPPVKVSKREIEVLKLIAQGFNNQDIALQLMTSKRTIDTHRQNLLVKTNCRNMAELIKYALLLKWEI